MYELRFVWTASCQSHQATTPDKGAPMTTITRPASKVEGAKAFSRRHDSSVACDQARAAWDARQDAVLDGVDDRAEARAVRTSHQQLELLDTRPGFSRREREKLNKRIALVAKATKKANALAEKAKVA